MNLSPEKLFADLRALFEAHGVTGELQLRFDGRVKMAWLGSPRADDMIIDIELRETKEKVND
jgi:hypothetical protein